MRWAAKRWCADGCRFRSVIKGVWEELSQLLTTLTHFPNDRPATKGTFGTMTGGQWGHYVL